MRRFLVYAALVLACSSCETSTATVDGHQLFFKTYPDATGTPGAFKQVVTLEGTAGDDVTTVEFSVETATTDAEVRLKRITVTNLKSGGWDVSFGGTGNPTNVGTHEKPVMSVPMMIHRYRSNGCQSESRTGAYTVRADGTVEEK